MKLPENTLGSARQWDAEDPLHHLREQFMIPKMMGNPIIYFTGNSLGLQPMDAQAALDQELEDWSKFGVEGHFHARFPWYSYHERLTDGSAIITGARREEVVVMNSLTVNLHLLLVSFFRPQGKRVKILTEQRPFPSDTYALASQLRFHGLDPKEHLVAVEAREGEQNLRQEDILARIEELGDELALVLFPGVQYFTGQVFDMEAIAAKAHEVGALAGFDLAHAVGNIPLKLHDWNVDFACWCTYKYLNSGPGSVGGAFVHQRHLKKDLPRFAGWWGHDKKTRFRMGQEFSPMATAEAWQLSNAPILNMAIHRLALAMIVGASMRKLRAKSITLTAYAEKVIKEIAAKQGANLEIITPADPEQRGAQLSVMAHTLGKELHQRLSEKGVSVDWRDADPAQGIQAGVIRLAPVPMYNSYEDVFRFGEILGKCLKKEQ